MRSPTRRLRFTKKAIEAIPIPATGRTVIYDQEQKDLGLRVSDSGRKSFFWLKRVRGLREFRPLGSFPETSIEAARGAARELTGALEAAKRTNFKEETVFDHEQNGEMTFEGLVERYIEKQVRTQSLNPVKGEKSVRWQFAKYLQHWRNRKLDQIRRKDVRELHDRLTRDNGPVTADRAAQLIRRVYRWAASGNVELYTGENPVNVRFNGYKKSERFLAPDELVRLESALKKEPNRDLADFVTLALATGARKSNVLAAEWSQFDSGLRVWTIPAENFKTGKTVLLPLADAARKVLRARAHLRESSRWVFPSTLSASGHLEEAKKPWRRLLESAQIQNFTVHGLRHTCASYQAMAGMSLQAIGKTLGQASTASTEIYAKLSVGVARESLEAGVKRMRKAMKEAEKETKLLTVKATA